MRPLLLLVPVVLAACELFTAPNSELEKNRARWIGAEVSNYDLELQRSCFCPLPPLGSVRVSVRADTIMSIVYVATGNPVDSLTARFYDLTVDDLFAVLDTAIALGADEIAATYDAALGYPRTISIDYDFRTVDEEQVYQAVVIPVTRIRL